MEAVQGGREAVEVGRRQIYEKARDLVLVPHGARVRRSIWKSAEKKRGKPFSRRCGARMPLRAPPTWTIFLAGWKKQVFSWGYRLTGLDGPSMLCCNQKTSTHRRKNPPTDRAHGGYRWPRLQAALITASTSQL
jgi:hypothetical protein